MTIDYPVPGPPTGPPGMSGHPHPGDWSSQGPDPMQPPPSILDVPLSLMRRIKRPNSPEAGTADENRTDTEDIRKVTVALPEKLSRCLAALEAAIPSCEGKLAVVAQGREEIKGEGARDHYSQAELDLKKKLNGLLGMRERIYELAVNMNDSLEEMLRELHVGVESWEDQDLDEEPPKRPKVSKPAMREPDSKPPSKDEELDDLAEIDL